MINVLAPLGLLALVGLVVLIVLSARGQRRALGGAYQDFADTCGFAFLEEDEGTAERFSRGFEGFASFRSSSLGHVPAKNVVSGTVTEGRLCVFTHGTREVEGQAREWFPCIVEAPRSLSPTGLVKCAPRRRTGVREVGGLAEVPFDHDPAFAERFVVRANDAQGAGDVLDASVRQALISGTAALPFDPEIQILNERLAVYPAGRNDDIENSEVLSNLVGFARSLVRAASS